MAQALPGNPASYNTSGYVLPNEDIRRKIALNLLMQGTSGEPVQAWSQGAARVAQSLLGGYELNQADQEDKAARSADLKTADDYANRSGPFSPPGAAPQASPVAAALGGAPPPAPGPSAQPAPPSPAPVATALAGRPPGTALGGIPGFGKDPQILDTAPPAATPVQAQPAPANDPWNGDIARMKVDALRLMKGGPLSNSIGQKLMEQAAMLELKKAGEDRYAPGKTDTGIEYDRNLNTGKREFAPPQTNMSVNTVADPVLKGVGDQITEGRKNAQSAAVHIIPSIHEARKALDQGAITGALANEKLGIQKIGALFGFDSAQIPNTEVLRSSVGSQVLEKAKTLGANPSNTDRDYIEKVVGGNITLDERSIRRLLDMQEGWARQSIDRFNTDADKLMRGNPKMYEQIAPLMKFEQPGQYQAPASKPADLRKKYGLE